MVRVCACEAQIVIGGAPLTVLQEQFHDRQMTPDGRLVQRRVAEPILNQRDISTSVDERFY